jgi:small subunit ribosomal protein S7
MARRRKAQRRLVTPDPMYSDKVVAKFINSIMLDGKKSSAQKIFYDALDQATKTVGGTSQLEVFKKLLDNVRPMLEVRSRRVGGATYQIPVEIPQYRQDALAIRWLIGFARAKKGIPMSKALAQEFADAYKGEGAAIKKRDDTHRMAEANRAFAHYRW